MTGRSTRTPTPAPGLACTPQVGSVRPGVGGAGEELGVWVGMSLSDSELLPRRFPQLPLRRTVRGPGPRGRHPQRPVSHQHCVSKGAGLGGQTGLDLHPGCVSLGKCLASLGLCLRESTGSSPHSKD